MRYIQIGLKQYQCAILKNTTLAIPIRDTVLFSTEPFFFISDLRFQTRCLIFAAHCKFFFLALNVYSPFNDCPSHLIDSTQFHASLKLYCNWFTPYYVIVHVIVVCLPHLFCEFQNQFYVWFYGGRTCF